MLKKNQCEDFFKKRPCEDFVKSIKLPLAH